MRFSHCICNSVGDTTAVLDPVARVLLTWATFKSPYLTAAEKKRLHGRRRDGRTATGVQRRAYSDGRTATNCMKNRLSVISPLWHRHMKFPSPLGFTRAREPLV